MTSNTYNDYKNEILQQYQKVCYGEYAAYLNNPTPAGLKQFAILCFENENALDGLIFERFFKFDTSKDKRRQLESFSVDRFKTLCNFLKNKNSLRNKEDADLIAVLVGYTPRPYNKFLNAGLVKHNNINEENAVEELVLPEQDKNIKSNKNLNKEERAHNKEASELTQQPEPGKIQGFAAPQLLISNDKPLSNKYKKHYIVAGLILVMTFTVGWIIFREPKKCMVWSVNHYDAVDCNDIAADVSSGKFVPLNEKLLKAMKKVEICDTTTFFNRDGSPNIWYGKSFDKKYEYFTIGGRHPETGVELKAITQYMVAKYVGGCK